MGATQFIIKVDDHNKTIIPFSNVTVSDGYLLTTCIETNHKKKTFLN